MKWNNYIRDNDPSGSWIDNGIVPRVDDALFAWMIGCIIWLFEVQMFVVFLRRGKISEAIIDNQ